MRVQDCYPGQPASRLSHRLPLSRQILQLSPTKAIWQYRQFYAGDYASAEQDFAQLAKSDRPWLAETAQYMLIRAALNKSSQNSVGEYGDFDITKLTARTLLRLRRWRKPICNTTRKACTPLPHTVCCVVSTGIYRRTAIGGVV